MALRFRGFEFALWREGRIFLRKADGSEREVNEGQRPQLEKTIKQLDFSRNSLTEDKSHFLYRASPEKWLETIIFRDPKELDAHWIRVTSTHRFPYFQDRSGALSICSG